MRKLIEKDIQKLSVKAEKSVMALNTVGAASQSSSDERMMVYFQANDGKMIVNDGELSV